jgi:hypothetical protein
MPKKSSTKTTSSTPKKKPATPAKTKSTASSAKSSKSLAKTASLASVTTFSLTADQSAFLKSLSPVTDAQIAHLRKVPTDVKLALNEQVVQAIHDNLALGGPDRAARITVLLAQQAKLVAVNAVLEPLVALVTNSLLAVNAELGDDAYEALKVANALIKTQPELARAMKPVDDWSRAHHPKAKDSVKKSKATS